MSPRSDALEPWDHKRLAEFLKEQAAATEAEVAVPIVSVDEVKVHSDAGEVTISTVRGRFVSIPRAKAKKR